MIKSHPAVDALEARLQSSVTLSTERRHRQAFFRIEAKGFRPALGSTVREAFDRFLRVNGLS
jgi:hypothetical protein